MKKVPQTIILNIVLYSLLALPFDASAAILLCNMGEISGNDCQKAQQTFNEQQQKSVEENRIRQEEINIQKEKDRKLQEKTAEKEKTEKLLQENEYKLKIKEIEERLLELESPQIPTVEMSPVVEKVQKGAITLDRNSSKEISSNEQSEIKKIDEGSVSDIIAPQPSVEKIGWLKRLINWFKK